MRRQASLAPPGGLTAHAGHHLLLTLRRLRPTSSMSRATPLSGYASSTIGRRYSSTLTTRMGADGQSSPSIERHEAGPLPKRADSLMPRKKPTRLHKGSPTPSIPMVVQFGEAHPDPRRSENPLPDERNRKIERSK